MSFEEKLLKVVEDYELVLRDGFDISLVTHVHSSLNPIIYYGEDRVKSFAIWLEDVGENIREKSLIGFGRKAKIPDHGQLRIMYNYEGDTIDSLDFSFYPYILPRVVDNNDGSKCFWRLGEDFIQRNESEAGLLMYDLDKGYFVSNRNKNGYCGMIFKAKDPCFDYIETFRLRRDLLGKGFFSDFLDLCDVNQLTFQ
jgi:hypothetical protein